MFLTEEERKVNNIVTGVSTAVGSALPFISNSAVFANLQPSPAMFMSFHMI